MPGGRLERGESLRHAVEREVLEETALEVEAGDLVGWVERMGAGFHFVILDFFASLIGQAKREAVAGRLPTLVAGDDAGEARWVPLDQIETLPLVNGLADFLTEHGVLPGASG